MTGRPRASASKKTPGKPSANGRVPGIDIGIRFQRGELPRLLHALPCLDGEEAKDDGIDRARNRDDDAADFVMSDKIPVAKTMVDEALAGAR